MIICYSSHRKLTHKIPDKPGNVSRTLQPGWTLPSHSSLSSTSNPFPSPFSSHLSLFSPPWTTWHGLHMLQSLAHMSPTCHVQSLPLFSQPVYLLNSSSPIKTQLDGHLLPGALLDSTRQIWMTCPLCLQNSLHVYLWEHLVHYTVICLSPQADYELSRYFYCSSLFELNSIACSW